jgi:hypothetical protein
LALAAHGIPSFTLTSLSLLSEVLESHPPSAIVTHASFLPQLLELIYDSAEGEHHTVIVVGDASAPTVCSTSNCSAGPRSSATAHLRSSSPPLGLVRMFTVRHDPR